jgi:hypothetical protein
LKDTTGSPACSWGYGANRTIVSGVTGWYDRTTDPTVVTVAASGYGSGASTLNANITDIACETCSDRGFDYDTDSGAPYASQWTEAGTYNTGTYSHAISPLNYEIQYYYRSKINDSFDGWVYGAEMALSYPLPGAPTNLDITQIDATTVTLTWTNDPYMGLTVVRGSLDGEYPDSPTDGFAVYSGTLATTNYTIGSRDLDDFKWRAWTHNLTGYSTSYISFGGTEMSSNDAVMFFALMIMVIASTVIFYVMRRITIGAFAALGWFFWGAYTYTLISDGGSFYTLMGTFIIFIGMFVSWEVWTDINVEKKADEEETRGEDLDFLQDKLDNAIDNNDSKETSRLRRKIADLEAKDNPTVNVNTVRDKKESMNLDYTKKTGKLR